MVTWYNSLPLGVRSRSLLLYSGAGVNSVAVNESGKINGRN